jgi:hypothetical protein
VRGVVARQRFLWLMLLAAIPASLAAVWGSPAGADDATDRKIADAALRESRELVARDLFGHYDLTELGVLRVEDLRGRVSAERDYGLVRVTLRFAARRNATRSASLSPAVFEQGPCSEWLYLHCGVPLGHVFDGKLEMLLAVDGDGAWRAVTPHWRSRRQYSLDGYLLLEGRDKDGYVLPPRP